MTPTEALIEKSLREYRQREWYAAAEWERKTRAMVKANVEVMRRSIGQRLRFIAARAAATRARLS